jgi:hypothetical protein
MPPMRSPLLALLIVLALSAVRIAASERDDADAAAAAGQAAMRDADADARKGVDAAIALGRALAICRRLGDDEAVHELQAEIFWCRKRMAAGGLADYVAKQGGTAAADLAVAQEVIDLAVPRSEAALYLERARSFQSAKTDQHFRIAVRFSEVVERFPDTPESAEAAPVFAKEQAAYLAQVAQERAVEHAQAQADLDRARRNRFMRPAAAVAGTLAVPDKASQVRALAMLRDLYKEDYASRKAATKQALARKLFTDADGSRDDAALYYVILDEAARLGADTEDYEAMLGAIDQQAAVYAGVDGDARKRKLLQRVAGRPIGSAILKLLSDPADKRSNLVAGKFWCFSMGRWDLGLPMITLGDDPVFTKAAELDLAPPAKIEDQIAAGEAWYDAGRRNGADRIPCYQRAQFWLLQVQPMLRGGKGIAVDKRLQEIDDALPLVDPDYDHLTAKQWEKLKGELVDVQAIADRNPVNIELTPDRRVRVVPHPDDRDRWSFQVGNAGQRQKAGVMTGSGRLWVWGGGRIRLKVVAVDD